jgi:hypothetical protein
MTPYPEGPLIPEYLHRGLGGLVRGIVRSSSGQPVQGCSVGPYSTALSAHGGPATAGAPAIVGKTGADGSYRLGLPAATYTIKAHGSTAANAPLYGEATGVVVTVGHTVIVDITVTEREDPPP